MASPSRIPALRHNNPVARSPGSYTLRTSPGKENRLGPGELAQKDMARDFLPFVKVLIPRSENHNKPEREAFLTHNRRTSIPKSPRKVFNPITSSNVSALAIPAAAASATQPGLGRGVPNSGSVCIPASTQTGPCLLMPTPSFAAFHKAEGDSEVELKVKKGRRQGMGWLKPHARGGLAPAQESLMLATPSFVALNASNSTASFASRYSLWHGKRGKRKADTNVAAPEPAAQPTAIVPGKRSSEADTAVPSPMERKVPQEAVDCFAPPVGLVFRSQDESSNGLPKDMLDTLGKLEAVAEEVKRLPAPGSPERPLHDVAATAKRELKGTTGPVFHNIGSIMQDNPCSQDAAPSEKTSVTSSATPGISKLPCTGRVALGRTVSTPSGLPRTPVRSTIPSIPRRAFSEQANKSECTPVSRPLPIKAIIRTPVNVTPKVSLTSTAKAPMPHLQMAPGTAPRTSPAVVKKPFIHPNPIAGNNMTSTSSGAGAGVVSKASRITKTSGLGLGASKLKTAIKPRLSEPAPVTASALRKVSPAAPISRIARKARHSALPRAG